MIGLDHEPGGVGADASQRNAGGLGPQVYDCARWESLTSASGSPCGTGEFVAVRWVRRHQRRPSSPPRGRCWDKQRGKGEEVYIGIGTVLAIVVIILLLIWIF